MAADWVPRCVRSPLLLGLALFLAACGHVPLMSMVTLSGIDFATTDPALLRAAIKLPQVIEPRLNGAALRVAVKLADGRDLAQDFKLSETTDERDVLPLHAELDPGTRVFAYRIEPGEVERLKVFRRTVLAQKQGQKAGLEISIKPDACRVGALPPGPLLMTTYIKTSETNRYVTLARDVDLRTLAAGRDAAAAIPACQ
jgi:hypothetical protein